MREKNVKHLRVPVTKQDEDKIKKRAKSVGLSVSGFMREFALRGYIVQRNVIELQRLTWEVNKIGTNINQIAKICNEGGTVSPHSMRRLQEEHAEVWRLLDRILNAEDRLFEFGKTKDQSGSDDGTCYDADDNEQKQA